MKEVVEDSDSVSKLPRISNSGLSNPGLLPTRHDIGRESKTNSIPPPLSGTGTLGISAVRFESRIECFRLTDLDFIGY